MRTPLFLCILLLAVPPSGGWLAGVFAPELHGLASRRKVLQDELAALGTPVVGQTAEQFGYQHPRTPVPPLNPASVQIDLGHPLPLDWIALVPAQLDWQSFDRPAYGFPRRFRIDVATEEEFHAPTVVADFTETDFPDPGVAPVAIHLAPRRVARFVRLTVTRFALDGDQHFFALSEILVLSGNRNVASGQPVSVTGRYQLKPRWAPENLVDGRTPLGPPIRRELIAYDGLFSDESPGGQPPFMQVDLGAVRVIDEVRLHPVHARIGADVPGFMFPRSFRVETSPHADFSEPELVFEARDFPPPGNNPVTIPTRQREARIVRFTTLPHEVAARRRLGLSEIEIYAGDQNIARTAQVARHPDRSAFSSHWPDGALVDGFTSYGRIIELPDWLQTWSRRRSLQSELATLAQDEAAALQRAIVRAWQTGAGLLLGLVVAGFALTWRSRRRRHQEIEALRLRLARDLHDEIGSNLASLAVTGELAAQHAPPEAREDWREVQRVSRESMDSMREVLWVLGSREESGLDLAARLERTAQRMLARQHIVWTAPPTNPPPHWDSATRREVFLFFKEALANICRHAEANRVTLTCGPQPPHYLLTIMDDGRGFDPAASKAGLGLKSLHERARTLRGRLTLTSSPGGGTSVQLLIPL